MALFGFAEDCAETEPLSTLEVERLEHSIDYILLLLPI